MTDVLRGTCAYLVNVRIVIIVSMQLHVVVCVRIDIKQRRGFVFAAGVAVQTYVTIGGRPRRRLVIGDARRIVVHKQLVVTVFVSDVH
jgi:hypothetical protein